MSAATRHVRLMTEREHYERLARLFDELRRKLSVTRDEETFWGAKVRTVVMLDANGAGCLADAAREKARECEVMADE